MPPGGGEAGGGLNDVWAFLGTIAAAASVVLANFFRTWRVSKGEEATNRPEKVILEQAELADLTGVRQLLADIRPKLEQLYDVERSNKVMLEGNRESVLEMGRVLRRLESELDVAQRIRQEEILRLSRHGDQRDG